jgi:hypothetical protein
MFSSESSFDEIVSRLQSEDARFSAKVNRIAARGPLGAARLGVLGIAWVLGTLLFVALSGWVGLVAASFLGGLLYWLGRS